MCRWLAYHGAPIFMDELLFQPNNSLINQSLLARHASCVTNGDGFGVGWYTARRHPGLFRDVRPAWNDDNLRSLSEQIEARLFFAHVRASTGTSTSRPNCHPFRHGNWMFMHNGKVGGYDRIRRALEFKLTEELYNQRGGTTDSEVLFLLAIGNGLFEDPVGAFRRTLGEVEQLMAEAGVEEPLRVTCAATDGERLYALRYSSDNASPSLFYAEGGALTIKDGECRFAAGPGSVLILSEPLDMAVECWHAVPEGQVLVSDGHGVTLEPFAIEARPALQLAV